MSVRSITIAHRQHSCSMAAERIQHIWSLYGSQVSSGDWLIARASSFDGQGVVLAKHILGQPQAAPASGRKEGSGKECRPLAIPPGGWTLCPAPR